jgi:dTMP kinase
MQESLSKHVLAPIFLTRQPESHEEVAVSALVVALEGIDGSGKGTQASRLCENLTRQGLSCGLIAFPRYSETTFGRTIARYLNGEFGDLHATSPHFAALLYAGDRFESSSLIDSQRSTREVLIFDRYVPSNLAHQAAKVAPPDRESFIAWVESVEYGVYRLPRPDLVIYLDMPVPIAQELITKKPSRVYTEKAADLHEADGSYLSATAKVYQQLAARDSTWRVIQCTRNDELRTADEVAIEITDCIRAALSTRACRARRAR